MREERTHRAKTKQSYLRTYHSSLSSPVLSKISCNDLESTVSKFGGFINFVLLRSTISAEISESIYIALAI